MNKTVGTIKILRNVKVYGKSSTFAVREYTEEDIPYFKEYFDLWKIQREHELFLDDRASNLNAGFTEGLFCIWNKSVRFVKQKTAKDHGFKYTQKLEDSSFDTYKIETEDCEQLKTSIGYGPSSFGPKSKQDKLYFMHFYNDGNIDGTFDIYEIPNNVLYSTYVNKNETFKQQQLQKRRPHLSLMKKVIYSNNIEKLAENVKLW